VALYRWDIIGLVPVLDLPPINAVIVVDPSAGASAFAAGRQISEIAPTNLADNAIPTAAFAQAPRGGFAPHDRLPDAWRRAGRTGNTVFIETKVSATTGSRRCIDRVPRVQR
jgi:hypothetical protein